MSGQGAKINRKNGSPSVFWLKNVAPEIKVLM